MISHAFKRHGMERGDSNLVLKRPGHVIKYDWLKKEKKEILSHCDQSNEYNKWVFIFASKLDFFLSD